MNLPGKELSAITTGQWLLIIYIVLVIKKALPYFLFNLKHIACICYEVKHLFMGAYFLWLVGCFLLNTSFIRSNDKSIRIIGSIQSPSLCQEKCNITKGLHNMDFKNIRWHFLVWNASKFQFIFKIFSVMSYTNESIELFFVRQV